jgi:hypothetical protein
MLRQDHLGASTFVEKGWNLIANGNFEAAEALRLADRGEKPISYS